MTMTTTPDTTPIPITVLGLGNMGSAISRAFLDRGHPTTVWNRTASKARPLIEAGGLAADTAAEAVTASPLVMLSVLDYEAVEDVLATVGDAIEGRTLVNVTSGSPDRARSTQQWATDHGAEYLDGGIMADPSDLAHGTFLYSGSRKAFDGHEATLRELGNAVYHGTDAGLASVEFMAQVAVGYELLIGVLHTLKLVKKEGVDVAEFSSRVAGALPGYAPILTTIGQAVRDGEYPPDLGPLSVQAALMGDLIAHRRSLGVDTLRMREVKDFMDRRVAEGHGDEGFSSIFGLLETGANAGVYR